MGGMVVSVAGPTKTGKTVLVEQVVGPSRIVSVSGGSIDSPDDVWRLAAGHLGFTNISRGETVDALIGDERVLVLDDFHYVARDVQTRIAQQLKEAAARGLQIVVILIPYRADDPIRGNPDLRGRVLKIDLDYWGEEQLALIAEIGFPLLNVDLSSDARGQLAMNSLRAPQLMHLLCLETCNTFGVQEPQEERMSISFGPGDFDSVARNVARYTDCASVYQVLRQGPAVRGRDRTMHRFSDGGSGDVYELVLRAIAEDHPALSIPMPELKARVSRVLKGGGAGGLGGSVANTVRNMQKILGDRLPTERVLEWDESRQTLDILDPYFADYLRWSVGGDQKG
jgi:hypothetical protein